MKKEEAIACDLWFAPPPNQAPSQKFAMGGLIWGSRGGAPAAGGQWGSGGNAPCRRRHEGLGAEPPAFEIFSFFCKNSIILGLF